MMHRAGHVLLRFLAGLVAGIAVLAASGLYLLSRGPIMLDSVAPYIARILSPGDLTIAIDHTLLSLDTHGHIVVYARGVHLERLQGGASLTLGDVALEFSPRAALTGVIAPSRIVVNHPELTLERSADGTFHLGVGSEASDTAEDWGAILVGALVHPPDGKGPLGYLTEFSVQDAQLTVSDRAFGVEWHAAEADASLIRSANRGNGNFRIVTGEGAGKAELDGDFTLLPNDDQLVVRLAFQNLKPALWSEAEPRLAGLALVNLPVSGELRAELGAKELTMRDAIADLHFGAGELQHALFPGGKLPVAGGSLQMGYDAVAGRINLGALSVDLAPGNVSVSGNIDGVGQNLLSGVLPTTAEAKLTVTAQKLRLDDFSKFWPETASESTRAWVTEHIHDGAVDTFALQLDMALDLTPDAPKPARVLALDGTMNFSNLSIEYFRPLPLVKNVNGTARFSPTEISFTSTGGDLGNIRATAATARFYQLDTHDEQAKITVDAEGPLADALALLDTPPLYYARDINIDPKRTAGNFKAKLKFDFPLLKNLGFDDIAYGADANLSDVSVAGILFNRDLSQGALTLKLDPAKAQIDGTAALAGVPLRFSWTQSLEPKPAIRTHYTVKATLDDAQRAALGFDFLAGAVSGPVGVDAIYDLTGANRARATASLDLQAADLDVKYLNWKKPAGGRALARVDLELADDKVTAIRDATLQGSGADAKAAVSFDDKGLAAVTIDHITAGDNDFAGSFQRNEAGAWRIAASGKSLDISNLFDELDRNSKSDSKDPAMSIDLKLDRLIAGPKRIANDVAAAVVSDGEHWQRASVDLKLSEKTTATLRFGAEQGEGQFKLSSDDLGGLLNLLGIFSDIEGGSFNLVGHTEDRQGQRTLITTAEGADYRVVRAPTLARLLSLASFSGMNALLTGQGIPFSRLEGEVQFATGKITLNNARAYGGAIGINASGTIDRAAGQMNVSGTVVPAYTLNSIIGDIPLIGNLLVGGQGQGIFASNFRVFGPIDKPEVSVNALSTLAPGFLRNLFLFSPRGP